MHLGRRRLKTTEVWFEQDSPLHLAEVGLQAHVFGPGRHLPPDGGGLGPDRLHLLLHLLPDAGNAHERRGPDLTQRVGQRTLREGEGGREGEREGWRKRKRKKKRCRGQRERRGKTTN